MKIKVNDIVVAWDGIIKLSGMELKISDAFWISMQLKVIEPFYSEFINKRTDLFRKYGEQSKEKPDIIEIIPDKISEFSKELDELLSAEIEINIQTKKIDSIDVIINAQSLLKTWFLWEEYASLNKT